MCLHAEGDWVQLTGAEQEGQTYPAGAVWEGKFWICDIKHFVCTTSIGYPKKQLPVMLNKDGIIK